jgi:lysophospholipase L1-like esterase
MASSFVAFLIGMAGFLAASANADSRGNDLVPVFARAHKGMPLRVAAIGGSITQAGNGWIGPWLREQFPKSAVTIHNAGMSATGSLLGVFRLHRDVIAGQPDLVLIEYAVNDGGLSDEEAIRYNESLIVRLKSLPHPPAIVFVEAAAKGGSNRARHQRVAAHYGLVDVDLQQAMDQHLAEGKIEWSALMNDSVHPNEAGHEFYGRMIAQRLAPFAEAARGKEAPLHALKGKLPPRISKEPLVLDGEMVLLDPGPGWRTEHSLPFWWSMFFNGVISAASAETELIVPARGTFLGLYYPLDKSYGSFCVNLDGGPVQYVDCSYRGGYEYRVLAKDATPGAHLLRLVTARGISTGKQGPVKLGYLLVAGETESNYDLVPQGSESPVPLAAIRFRPIPAGAWEWNGPYGGAEKTTGVTSDLESVFPPEPGSGARESLQWKKGEGEDSWLDLARLTGNADRGITYVRTRISGRNGKGWLALSIDYFGKVWVNGKLIEVLDKSHGAPRVPVMIPIDLEQPENILMVKVHAGSGGNGLGVSIGFAEAEEPAPEKRTLLKNNQ